MRGPCLSVSAGAQARGNGPSDPRFTVPLRAVFRLGNDMRPVALGFRRFCICVRQPLDAVLRPHPQFWSPAAAPAQPPAPHTVWLRPSSALGPGSDCRRGALECFLQRAPTASLPPTPSAAPLSDRQHPTRPDPGYVCPSVAPDPGRGGGGSSIRTAVHHRSGGGGGVPPPGPHAPARRPK